MALKHYVCFLSPGSFLPNEKWLEIKSREDKIDAPDNCFAYYFFDREEVEQDGELLKGEAKNESGRFYFGKAMTAQEIERTEPNCEILLANMRINKWEKVVKTRMGNFQPIEKNDVILELQTN